MAIQIPGFSMSLEASADLSAFQFHFVEVDSNGRVTISNGAGESVFGVLQNDPDALGVAASIMKTGVTKCVAAQTIVAGELIQTNASGRGMPAASADFVVGRAIDGVQTDGQIFSLALGENQRLP